MVLFTALAKGVSLKCAKKTTVNLTVLFFNDSS